MTGWTFHGGRLSAARGAYGDGDWLDLSTGINPYAWPGAGQVVIDWRALPDERALIDLEAAAAAYFGVDPALVCALPGTEIGLRLLGDILPAPHAHVAPSYRTHADIFHAALPADRLPVAGTSLILANPNNPDGRILPRADLIEQADRATASGHVLVVDEAFVDAMPELSLAAEVSDRRQLILFRSFGKFFGLAGVRLGFVIAPQAIVSRFRALLGSWPVSSAAIAIGRRAYRDAAWIADIRQRLPREAAALDRLLVAKGFSPVGACPLFRLIETADAPSLFDRLARQAILTRPFDYESRWLRLGLPAGTGALDRLDRALPDV